MPTPDITTVRRAVYVGGPATPQYVVRSVALKPLGKVNAVKVASLAEYEAGCSLHRGGCFGHPCETLSGISLVPQSLVMSKGETANDYLKAAKRAFSGDADGYKDALREMNLTKAGKMRKGILGSVVAGSARLIIVPQVQFPRGTIAFPRNIASLMRIPVRLSDSSTGLPTDVIDEKPLVEGDWCVLGRPPSLTLLSTQPMRIALWDVPTVGISPGDVGFWHGDFDGDEMHIYVVCDPESISECERWQHQEHKAFARETTKLEDMGYRGDGTGRQLPFISMTTVSMAHIRDAGKIPMFAAGARIKKEHYSATGTRFNQDIEANYVAESIRGMSDVARQQLTQGRIGYMSRIAKIVSMCFVRSDGYVRAQTSQGLLPIRACSDESYGCPCLRGISAICSVAQQAALDSHRAGTDKMASYDMISNMLTGGNDTIVVLEPTSPLVRMATWKAMRSGKYVAVVEASSVESVGTAGVVGAYSPWVLKDVGNPFDVCKVGITLVCNYFSILIASDEIFDMCCMFTYRCEESDLPITCAAGLGCRGIGWVDHLMATSYKNIMDICDRYIEPEEPVTGTSALFTGNFSLLNG